MCSFANRFVFVIGGDSGDQVIRIDLATDKWECMPSIEDDIINPSCCTLGNAIYVYFL